MMIAIAAEPADFAQFEWFTNDGPTWVFKPGGDRHDINVARGDLIGLKKTVSGPTAGRYQVILAKYPHWIFRSIMPEVIEKRLPKFVKTNSVPTKPEKTGQRHARVKIKGADAHDKQTALKYKPEKLPKEVGQYDKADYQWREVVHGPIPISTMHHKKTRPSLQKGDIVGVRFWTSARGGFILMPSGERVNISEMTYENVTSGATILPSARQQKGIVVLTDIAHQLPKRARMVKPKPEPIEKELEWEDDEDTEHSTKLQGKRGKNFLDQHKDIVSDFDYKDDDDEDEWETDDDFDEFEEDDEEETEETDSEENVNTEDDDDIQYAEEGMILQMANGKQLVIIGIEEKDVSDMLYLFDRELDNIRTAPIPTGADMRKLPRVKLMGHISQAELENIKRRTARRMNR